MNDWFIGLEDESQAASLKEAERSSGIPAKAIEKDLWVTRTLRALFDTAHSGCFVFKGGTSLSKGWQLIERFSEDIDIALDPAAFGYGHPPQPSKTYVEKLRRAGSRFVEEEILRKLKESFMKSGIPPSLYSIEVEGIRKDKPDTDPRSVNILYRSLFVNESYLPDRVKMEFSVRTRGYPSSKRTIRSILSQYLPSQVANEVSFEVMTMDPRTTFVEKLLLLHEEYNRIDAGSIRTERMSRHFYDIHMLSHRDFSKDVVNDPSFVDAIISHRRHYSRLKRFDYDTLKLGRLNCMPDKHTIIALERDYESMRNEMIYGHSPSFSEIFDSVQRMMRQLNSHLGC